ncbi:hypothetical protein BwSH20_11440 [Bradyrhizobium ottawaense]|nr:hypothetical protein SG09_57980 [Bradyrhizobium ottawaense]GMO28771.1 hypothetical protein BwSF21_28970 [Bradyrhizobium ottawaense]GMO37795.1 hypothetical protein BwSH14_46050 [Bradyrhizobium ottawaense]GMO44064.1 hypothetical protein BwSF12_48290 [Bradyrhizobium ottawaense]GMO55307.1 hypothetical protein BwSG20_03460 [Bradyrhizobium ottawaense]
MGPGSAAHHFVLRRVRGTRLSVKVWHRLSSSRHIVPELLLQLPPSKVPRAQGRPGAGWHPRSTVRKRVLKKLHSGIQV